MILGSLARVPAKPEVASLAQKKHIFLRRRCLGAKALKKTGISVLECSRAALCDGEVVITIFVEKFRRLVMFAL